MFLTLHLSWLALTILLVQLQMQHICQKSQASTQIYVYPIPLETLLWDLWGFPSSPSMFANERTTCSIIIYRIFCLFIIAFFQKENGHSHFVQFMSCVEFFILSWVGVQLIITEGGVFEKWTLLCEADMFMIVSKCWNPSEPVIGIIYPILWGGLRRGQWAVSLVIAEKSAKEQLTSSKEKKKALIVFTVHVSHHIFRHIQDVLHLNALPRI